MSTLVVDHGIKPGRHKHFGGGYYVIQPHVSYDSEAPDVPRVNYISEQEAKGHPSGTHWSQPIANFLSPKEREDGSLVERFTWVGNLAGPEEPVVIKPK